MEPFNLRSSDQVQERLLELGWVPTTFSKVTGNPTVAKDAFDNLPPDAPKEARLIGEYRMSRSRQNLAQQIIEARDSKGYVHGYIDIMGANTHRMSSNSPNLQNIPSTKEDKATKESLSGVKGRWGWECRDVFTVSDPRRFILVDADASGIQLRGLAHYGGDDEYIRLVSDPSIDIHDVHASVLGCSRAVAKTFIYAFLMGAGAKKLISILGGSDKELGEELLERFYKRFPFLKKFKKELDSQVEIGYYVALDGRLIALDREKPHKAMAVALQSFEVIIMKKALTFYHKDLNTRKIPFIQRLMVHDEFLTETLIEYKDEVGKAMANAIIKAGEYFGSKCPLDGKYKTGRTWAECH
jgi:DNA polymerase I-like protein with 3'-5' exonuclease and polymerase domains